MIDELTWLNRRIAQEVDLAAGAATASARQIHTGLASIYRSRLAAAREMLVQDIRSNRPAEPR